MLASSLISFLLLHLMAVTMALTADPLLLSCGALSGTTDESDGRRWDTDTDYPNFLPLNFSSISSTATASDTSVTRVPYMSARIFQSKFTYTLPVSTGTKFLRFYFYPAPYLDINESESFFSVTANHFALLSNFSAFFTDAGASTNSSKALRKEFVINVNETQILKITFSPSPNSYAFVNGIEIVSMPANLYIQGDDHEIKMVGRQNSFYYINNSTALKNLYRLNVGGNFVPSTEDTGMYRVWAADDDFVFGYGYETLHLDVNITYTSETPAYTAPNIVYTTSRTMANYSQSLDWIFPLDSGFYYLFRLHFCEIQLEVKEQNYRVFDILIGNKTADQLVDVIQRSGGSRVPMYTDHVVFVRDPDGRRGKKDVSLELRPNMETKAVYENAILNGLEIFKLSDPNGNLAVPYPESFFERPKKKKKKNISSHIIVVIITGVISGIAVFSILGFLISWRRNGGKAGSGTKKTGSSSLPSDMCRHFLIEEIKNATGNFDEKFVIGHGGFGNVYKGYLNNGTTTVAVKRSNPSSKQGVREFQTEIEMLSSKLRHRHLVSLIGYCDDNNEMILVYDYMANGTLRDQLYDTDNAPLPWKKRLDICIGAAKGLYYLHSGTKYTIIHRDVKSTNILLDDKWVAKVSDFGLSKVGSLGGIDVTHVSTAVKGSFGYVDPEYYKRQKLTEKSDVYSFGVIMFEVLCSRPAISPNLSSEQVNLAEWACRSCTKGNLERIIDPNLEGQISPECLSKYVELAYHCLRDQGIQRPTMGDIVKTLEFALQLQEDADNRGHEVEGYIYPPGSSSPLITNGHVNIATNEEEIFPGLNEVERKLTDNDISISTSRSARLKNITIFSEIMNPLGR
ncbi:receptor-like protein kinase FERONIA [Capsicum annuum]|uniref:LOW QUALITY PROTEIN: receptor-like protein kinase FERONIA n=1 Tax=Capsicum annuum TaxID=4072 RepID=UPI0007BEBA17|nr:LOW QUALITY PROTEIN: receptor-like protein kinase FERONIA [Capsicum annuum]